jgi:UDP-3-O-acyl N-acetylglucosamine deacetylase
MTPVPRKQRTLARSAAVEGFGYWSGRDVCIEFHPAPENTGVVFCRSDLKPPVWIAAAVENRTEAPRRTTLAAPGAAVEMVEHILAALAGLEIDNCQVRANAPEMPGGDGSSLIFVDALKQAGVVEQASLRPMLVVTETTRVGGPDCWVEASPSDSPCMTVRYHLDYGRDNPIGRETIELAVTPETFEKELAPARTFLLKHEANWLRAQGLGTRATYRDLLVFDDCGPIDNELRFVDECVRHKTLDLIGDLALAGRQIVGHITAHRSGHRQNAELVQALLKKANMMNRRPAA